MRAALEGIKHQLVTLFLSPIPWAECPGFPRPLHLLLQRLGLALATA